MTPNFVTGLVPTHAIVLPETLAALTTSLDSDARDLGFATVIVGTRHQAQGRVIRRYRDGRVSIDAGGRSVTGHPLGGTAPRGWWARLGGRPV